MDVSIFRHTVGSPIAYTKQHVMPFSELWISNIDIRVALCCFWAHLNQQHLL